MKERLFYLWRMFNRIFICFFVTLYLVSIPMNMAEHGVSALILTPEIILGQLFAGELDPLNVCIVLFLTGWLIGWITTGRHAWNIGSNA